MAGNEKAKVEGVTLETVKGLIAKAMEKLMPADKVSEVIAEAMKNVVTGERAKEIAAEAMKGLVTEERLKEAIGDVELKFSECMDVIKPAATVELKPFNQDQEQQIPLDTAWLNGLKFRGAKSEKKVVDGRPKLIPVPYERALQVSDVLSYRVAEEAGTVTLVTADGQKHVVQI